ncbi:MAG: RNA polymerase sigma-70 factor [Bacteroidota bacterium]
MPKGESNKNQFLLSELQKGEERAFDFIFRKYYKVLCAQANAYVKDLDKSQSLVQDCLIKLWENRESVEDIKNLASYLSFMVRNQCIDYLRKIKPLKELHGNEEDFSDAVNCEDLFVTREFEERLVVILSSLPERSRVAFGYSRFENLTYKEIAEKMNISVKAIEALVSRALKILRKELKKYLPIFLLLYKITRF